MFKNGQNKMEKKSVADILEEGSIFDFERDLGNHIEWLQEIKQRADELNIYKEIRLELDYWMEGDDRRNYFIRGYRWETDEEFNKRTIEENDREKKIDEREKELYEKLKKKYEKG